jgi:hypothetical protein
LPNKGTAVICTLPSILSKAAPHLHASTRPHTRECINCHFVTAYPPPPTPTPPGVREEAPRQGTKKIQILLSNSRRLEFFGTASPPQGLRSAHGGTSTVAFLVAQMVLLYLPGWFTMNQLLERTKHSQVQTAYANTDVDQLRTQKVRLNLSPSIHIHSMIKCPALDPRKESRHSRVNRQRHLLSLASKSVGEHSKFFAEGGGRGSLAVGPCQHGHLCMLPRQPGYAAGHLYLIHVVRVSMQEGWSKEVT